MSSNETPVPESVIVTCLTCHERIGVSLTAETQVVRCTFCEAEVKVPSRDEVVRNQAAKQSRTAAQIGDYAIAAPDDAQAKKPTTFQATRTAKAGKSKIPDPTITVECPTCHEIVRAKIGPNAYRIPCTFCAVLLSIPDSKTVAGWKAREVAPRSSEEIGEYAAGPVLETKPMRPGNVFDRLAEIRQEVAPAPPNWTFFSGVFTFPWRTETRVRWIYLSIGFTAIVGIGVILKGLAAEFSGFASGAAVAFFVLPIIWILFFTLSYAAACGLHVFESTAAGLDQIEAWPEPNWRDWMVELMYLGWIGAIPMALSYGLALLGVTQGVPIFVTLPAVFFVLYPISLLSALEANTIWVPLTMPILSSLWRWSWCWLMFYVLSGLTIGAIAAAAIFLITSSLDAALLCLGPALAAAALVYFRLLGRLAWRMTTKVKKRKKDRPSPAPQPKS